MKRLFYLVATIFMAVGFTSCIGDDVNEEDFVWDDFFSYVSENKEYIRNKKTLVGSDGKPLYEQLVVSGDTVLYRILSKSGSSTVTPTKQTVITTTLKGDLIDGTNFQPNTQMQLTPSSVITGLQAVLLKNTVGERVEAIIPASLGYGYDTSLNVPVPAGSTLIFTYVVEKFE